MNYALIFAGGVGNRMNSKTKPKQFLEIKGKPIIIYTIEHFESHPEIDAICVVCVPSWLEYMRGLLEKFNIHKVRWLIPGGETALDSQYKGLCAIKESEVISTDDIVLIHDGVRPMIHFDVISDNIDAVKKYGSAITVAPAIETIIKTDANNKVASTINRDECMLARAPQSFLFKQIYNVHEKSVKQGTHDYIDSASMMLAHGYSVHVVEGPAENIKITTPSDFYTCRALLDAKECSQIFGL